MARLAIAGILVAVAAGCGGAGEGGPGSGTSGIYAGLNEYEAIGAAKQILSDESTQSGSPVHRKAMLTGPAARSGYPSDGADAWRVEVLTLDEKPSGLCVWVSAQGTDPLNYDYVYELDRCDIALPLLDRSEEIQGQRDEIDEARAQCEN